MLVCDLSNGNGRWIQISREQGCHSHWSIHAANIALSCEGGSDLSRVQLHTTLPSELFWHVKMENVVSIISFKCNSNYN